MKINIIKHILVFFLAGSLSVAFAQGVPKEAPPKLAVYVFGTIDANLNKAFSDKLLAAMVKSGSYAEIANPGTFQTELASSKSTTSAQITQAAKQRGADFVCAVNLTGASNVYSMTAGIVKTSNSQAVKTGSLANRTLKSLDDLTLASNELARQLLPPPPPPPPPPVATPAPVVPPPVVQRPVAPPPVVPRPVVPPNMAPAPAPAKKQCAKTYNINDIVSKLKGSFPSQLNDCSSRLDKENAQAAALQKNAKKKSPPVEKKEPKVFMKQCATDEVKRELPDGFTSTDKLLGLVENFVQNNAVDANIDGFLSDVKKLAASDGCIVEAPAPKPLPVVAPPKDTALKDTTPPAPKKDTVKPAAPPKSTGYWGVRAGINFSHLSATALDSTNKKVNGTYGDVFGFQFGLVADMAPLDLLHVQPGFMYIQKGTKNNGISATAHYVEIPLLLSLNISMIRINAGPYLGIYFGSIDEAEYVFSEDFGISTGLGVDYGMFYIGAFYNYGLLNISYKKNYDLYNRTLGLNIGVNL